MPPYRDQVVKAGLPAVIAFYAFVGTLIASQVEKNSEKRDQLENVTMGFFALFVVALFFYKYLLTESIFVSAILTLFVISMFFLILGGYRFSERQDDRSKIVMLVGAVLATITIIAPHLLDRTTTLAEKAAKVLLYISITTLITFGVMMKIHPDKKEEYRSVLIGVGAIAALLFGYVGILRRGKGDALDAIPALPLEPAVIPEGFVRVATPYVGDTFASLFGRRRRRR